MRPTGSIRERSKGNFQIRYTLGIDPNTNKAKRIEVTHKGTYDSAKQELRRLLKSVDDNQHVEPTKIRVGEFLTQWLKTTKAQVSPATHERYEALVNHYLIPAFGTHLLSKLTPMHLQAAYNIWGVEGRRDKKEGGLSPRTRVHLHRVLKSALKNAVQLQLLGRNPADAVKPPKAKKAAITVLTVEQSTVLLEALKPYRIYWPVLLAVSTGMRRGEILALRWKNVDFNSGTVRVIESLERTSKGLRFKSPKTEKTRAVVLPAHALEELRTWKEAQAKELHGYSAVQSEETLVCGTREGDPMNPAQLTHVFIDCIRKFSGIVPKVRFHDLRHSHATQLLTAGIHPKIAQERLGHSTITTTLDLYSHVTNTMQADAATRLDTAFRSAMKARSNLTPKPQ